MSKLNMKVIDMEHAQLDLIKKVSPIAPDHLNMIVHQ